MNNIKCNVVLREYCDLQDSWLGLSMGLLGILRQVERKGKVDSRISHEGPEGE